MSEANGASHAPSPSPTQPQPPTTSSQPATQTPAAPTPSASTSQAIPTQISSTAVASTAPAADAPASQSRDDGASTRPRDARTLHLVLNAMGVTAYQDRVPLQLLDFAYRYTSGILSDAQHLAAEGYVSAADGQSKGGARAKNNTTTEEVNLAAIKLATASRLGYQFHGPLPKESLLEMAGERNKMRLPGVGEVSGMRLPHERFVLASSGWKIPEEWDSEGDAEEEAEHETTAEATKANGAGRGEGEDDEEMGETTAEDLFGAGGEDDAMEET